MREKEREREREREREKARVCERERNGQPRVLSLVGETGLRFRVFAVIRSSSEEGSYSRLVDFLYHSTLGRE